DRERAAGGDAEVVAAVVLQHHRAAAGQAAGGAANRVGGGRGAGVPARPVVDLVGRVVEPHAGTARGDLGVGGLHDLGPVLAPGDGGADHLDLPHVGGRRDLQRAAGLQLGP